MDENVLASVVRLNKAEALLIVKPLYSTFSHGIVLKIGCRESLISAKAALKDPSIK